FRKTGKSCYFPTKPAICPHRRRFSTHIVCRMTGNLRPFVMKSQILRIVRRPQGCDLFQLQAQMMRVDAPKMVLLARLRFAAKVKNRAADFDMAVEDDDRV